MPFHLQVQSYMAFVMNCTEIQIGHFTEKSKLALCYRAMEMLKSNISQTKQLLICFSITLFNQA